MALRPTIKVGIFYDYNDPQVDEISQPGCYGDDEMAIPIGCQELAMLIISGWWIPIDHQRVMGAQVLHKITGGENLAPRRLGFLASYMAVLGKNPRVYVLETALLSACLREG
jgi:hypothetical protein